MMYVALSAGVQSQDLKALASMYEQIEVWRALYVQALRVLETEFYGNCWFVYGRQEHQLLDFSWKTRSYLVI